MIVWLNGQFLAGDGALSADDRGFLIGDGAFETILFAKRAPAFLEAHLKRLEIGLDRLQIDGPPLGADLVCAAARRLADENEIEGAGVLRVTISRGRGGRGADCVAVEPTRLITLEALAAPKIELRTILARQRRFSGAATSRFKSTGGYADNLVAQREARAAGADESLMLNEFGRLAGASVSNVFLVEPNGEVATPPVDEGALPGIVRTLLIAGASAQGVAISERPIEAAELEGSSLFSTNSLRGLAPVAGEWPAAARAVFQRLETWYLKVLAEDLELAGMRL